MEFKHWVPEFILNSNIMKELYNTQYIKLKEIKKDVEDLKLQLFIDTATWGLDAWEIEYDLPVNPNISYDERRRRIKARMLKPKKTGADIIEDLAYRILGVKAKVSFEDRIIINLLTGNEIDLTNDIWRNEFYRIKPAHLGVNFKKETAENIFIKEDYQMLKIKYPISNKARTESRKVHAIKDNLNISEKYKLFPVNFDVSGRTKAKSVEVDTEYKNIKMIEEEISSRVKYGISGNFVCGGGV